MRRAAGFVLWGSPPAGQCFRRVFFPRCESVPLGEQFNIGIGRYSFQILFALHCGIAIFSVRHAQL